MVLKLCMWCESMNYNNMQICDFLIQWPKVRYNVMTSPLKHYRQIVIMQISLVIMVQLRYNFQDNHILGLSRPEDNQFWFVTSSRSLQTTDQHLGVSCSVATWRISFGLHIWLEFRYYALLHDRFRRFPTKMTFLAYRIKFGLCLVNLTRGQILPLIFFLGQHAYISMRLDVRNTMVHIYLGVSFSSKVIGKKHFLPKRLFWHFLTPRVLSVGPR